MEIKSPHTRMANAQQRNVMRVLLLITFFHGLTFSLLNFYRGLYSLAIAEILMSTISLLFYFKTQMGINYYALRVLSSIYLFFFYIGAVLTIWIDNSIKSIIVWVFLTPLLCYFILGRRLGSIMTVLASSSLIGVFIYKSLPSCPNSFNCFLFLTNIIFCLFAIWFLVHAYAQGGIYHQKKLAKQAMEDQLTGLYNRTVLHTCFEQHKNDDCLSMAILDIDWFKNINDTYGHDVGDRALIHISDMLKQSFNDTGYVIRLGGEEFAIIFPKIEKDLTYQVIQKFLEMFRETTVQSDRGAFRMTFSAGVAQYPQEADSFLTLQKLADRRLYNAKNHGRNCICRWYQIEDDIDCKQ